MATQGLSITEVIKLSSEVHVDNQNSHAKMGVSTVNVCSIYVCVLGRVKALHNICMYGCFVISVCMHGLAVVEALWRPTGIYWNQCVKHALLNTGANGHRPFKLISKS